MDRLAIPLALLVLISGCTTSPAVNQTGNETGLAVEIENSELSPVWIESAGIEAYVYSLHKIRFYGILRLRNTGNAGIGSNISILAEVPEKGIAFEKNQNVSIPPGQTLKIYLREDLTGYWETRRLPGEFGYNWEISVTYNGLVSEIRNVRTELDRKAIGDILNFEDFRIQPVSWRLERSQNKTDAVMVAKIRNLAPYLISTPPIFAAILTREGYMSGYETSFSTLSGGKLAPGREVEGEIRVVGIPDSWTPLEMDIYCETCSPKNYIIELSS